MTASSKDSPPKWGRSVGGCKPAFQFDSSFLRGYAYPYCETFLSHRLSTEEEFIMDECEVWLFSEWERS